MKKKKKEEEVNEWIVTKIQIICCIVLEDLLC